GHETGKASHVRQSADRDLPAVAAATVLAATLSGLPSTIHAFATGREPLAAARAAGTLLPGRRDRPGLVAGAVMHAGVSVFWGAVLAGALPRRATATAGAAAGLAIAALDLGVVGRRFPAIAALPTLPQVADHVAFGVVFAVARSRWSVPVERR
ncbi:MAG: hypothetical protein ACRD0U_05890, partial [Acidimicrobiales bacterium]